MAVVGTINGWLPRAVRGVSVPAVNKTATTTEMILRLDTWADSSDCERGAGRNFLEATLLGETGERTKV